MIILIIRLLALAYIAFLAYMALDVFNIIGFTLLEKIVAFIVHLAPAFLAAVCLAVAWKRRVIGGALFLLMAAGFTLWFHTYLNFGNFIVVSLPLILIGSLFVWAGLANEWDRLRRLGALLIVILLLICLGAGAFYLRYQAMANNLQKQYDQIKPVDLKKMVDGVYKGSCGDFLVEVEAAVTVKNHRIDQIKILKQSSGPGHEARPVTDRIIKAQQPRVDAVSGATGSSYVIMVAVYRALTGKE